MKEFMERLEFLLQDIPEQEKEDAIAYYRDYIEEAGPENEAKVLEEFGSPERVAAIIRTDLAGGMEEGGEFTEKGFQDERFRDPNSQIAKRLELPEESKSSKNGGTWNEQSGPQAQNNFTQSSQDISRRQENAGRQKHSAGWWILVILGVLVLSPLLLGTFGMITGIIGGGFGILIGILVFLAVLFLALGAITVGCTLGSIVAFIFGISRLFVYPANGMLLVGEGFLILGIGLFSLVLAVVFYGNFLPWIFRGIVNLLSRLLHRRRSAR